MSTVRFDSAAADVNDRRRDGALGVDGQYLAFVPTGVELPDGLLTDLVGTLDRNVTVGAVAPRASPEAPTGRVLATPPGVLVVRTALWRLLGGFAREAGPLADLDFGWRLNLAGYEVRVRADLVVGAIPSMPPVVTPGDHPGAFRAVATRCFGPACVERVLPALRGVNNLADPLAVELGRVAVQATRVRTDDELFPLLAPLFEPAAGLTWDAAVLAELGGDRLVAGRHRIVVVTGDTLGERMAGPAIRAWEMAGALSADHDVVLASLGACSLTSARFRTEHASAAQLRRLVDWCDVLVFQGHLLTLHPWLADSPKVLVADVYDPIHLETLEQDRSRPAGTRAESSRYAVDTMNNQLRRADFLLCASGKQRDLWLGHLASLGRLNPSTYDGDEDLDGLIAIAPFGRSAEPPVRTRPANKGVVPGIGADDKVILWGGGIYNWFDPLTLIRAVDHVRHEVPAVRLYFLGVKHPNPAVPAMRMAHAAQQLAAELGLLDSYVFFNPDWVAYEDRQNFLLDADIGVSCHFRHVETAFSFRTRILDYLWASLPIVSTAGDSFAELIAAEGLGEVVPPEDLSALAAALTRLLTDDGYAAGCRQRVAAASARFTWEQTLAPLVAFCRAPHVARDRGSQARIDPMAGLSRPARDWRAEWDLTRRYFAAGGVREVTKRLRGRVGRVVRR